MESTKLKLYVGADFVSAFAMSAFVALKEKQLSFELVTLDLKARENYQANYRDLSLTCKIPTLIHQGFALSESSAIAEYLEEIAPGHNRLLPLDIKQRARARQLQAWLRSDLLVIRKERPADLIYFGKKDTPLSDDALAAVDRLFFVADRLLEGGAEHLFGDWSIADTDLAIMLNRLVANGDEVPSRLAAYVRRQWDRDSVRAWMDIERAAPAIQ
ncbi:MULTISPECIES: glutathione transferase [unclassified Pseudomonas]|jgi:glutathione S-transferase|uniref:glutathione transferase n=1 Tax=unclassified Pseudomonas TaxID=196821 RepID=UPI000C879529|nr:MULTISPECIES: glutathione transferase [unclassified Pseudomonas]PMU12336.1 glutathione S-transferase [Pseudomonas sp. FW305-20]PMU19659.1 glutathione S-transferase [Pseudomonas sp. FW305-122]PMU42671.1 glutathione S-transferase [Pseudomonas sp. FW305-47B]PMX62215.1 glutathione S-transferase [Pseudomonas sp. FW305-33]PMX69902.1 glutathione S-transferase [Pseudomonas sp. FW305-60]